MTTILLLIVILPVSGLIFAAMVKNKTTPFKSKTGYNKSID